MKTVSKRIALATLLCMILVSLAGAQTVEMVDGVKVIKNEGKGKWANNPKVGLELEKKIGELDAEDENYLLYLPNDITKDKDGNIYILDAGNYLVKKFTPEGKFMLSFGEQGQGPGEFSVPSALYIADDGNIVVADTHNKRFEVFSPTGTRIKDFSFGDNTPGTLRLDKNGNIVSGGGGPRFAFRMGDQGKKEKEAKPVLTIFDQSGEIVKKIGELEDYGSEITNRFANRFSFDVDAQDNFIVAYRSKNRIDKFAPDGTHLFSIQRPLNFEESKVEKENVKRDGQAFSIRIPDMNLISQAVAVDAQGRIWSATANRQRKDEENVGMNMSISGRGSAPVTSVTGNTELTETDMFDLEIFSENGELLGKIRLNHFVDSMKIIDNKLYILDRMRGMQYYEYNIINK